MVLFCGFGLRLNFVLVYNGRFDFVRCYFAFGFASYVGFGCVLVRVGVGWVDSGLVWGVWTWVCGFVS